MFIVERTRVHNLDGSVEAVYTGLPDIPSERLSTGQEPLSRCRHSTISIKRFTKNIAELMGHRGLLCLALWPVKTSRVRTTSAAASPFKNAL